MRKDPSWTTVWPTVRVHGLEAVSESLEVLSRAKMRAEIECAGLSLAKDFSVSEWGVAFAGAKSRARRARLAVAHPS